MQWGISSVFLLIVITILLVNFSTIARKQSCEKIQSKIEKQTEDYAEKLYNELNVMTEAGKPVAEVLGALNEDKSVLVTNMEMALCNNSEAYRVVYADRKGRGIDQKGKQTDISKEPYYNAALQEQKYGYTEADCMEGKSAIVSMIPVYKEDQVTHVLYLYYPTERFGELFQSGRYVEDTFFVLLLEQGKIVETAGHNTEFMNHDNLYNMLFGKQTDEKSVQSTWLDMRQLKSGYLILQNDKEEVFFTYAPIKINHWYLAMGINNRNVQRLIAAEWSAVRQSMVQLIVTFLAFFAFVVGINVINKLNYNRHSKSLEIKADTDLLTGLYNKMATEREIKNYIKESEDHKALLFLIDIDNFKKINDTMGHAFGDEVLRSLGARLKLEFRKSDIIGRVGGDEMILFLKNIPDSSTMKREVERVGTFYQNVEVGEYVKYVVTASIGVAVYPDQGADFATLYGAADRALYEAKRRGKNCIEFHLDEKKEI